MQTRLPLFLQWGIQFGQPYETPEQSEKAVSYVERLELEREIVRRRDEEDLDDFMEDRGAESEISDAGKYRKTLFRPPLRTD